GHVMPRELEADHAGAISQALRMVLRPAGILDDLGDAPTPVELHAADREPAHLRHADAAVAALDDEAADAGTAELDGKRQPHRPAARDQHLYLLRAHPALPRSPSPRTLKWAICVVNDGLGDRGRRRLRAIGALLSPGRRGTIAAERGRAARSRGGRHDRAAREIRRFERDRHVGPGTASQPAASSDAYLALDGDEPASRRGRRG